MPVPERPVRLGSATVRQDKPFAAENAPTRHRIQTIAERADNNVPSVKPAPMVNVLAARPVYRFLEQFSLFLRRVARRPDVMRA